MDVALFDYHLPPELIAQAPVEPRDSSRLMVVRRGAGTWSHHRFFELPGLLGPRDLLARNVSKVLPARLVGTREATGGRWEGLFLSTTKGGDWWLLATTRGRPRIGEWLVAGEGLRLRLEAVGEEGRWLVRPESDQPAFELLSRHGRVPLPPYIRKGNEGPGDRERYQTVYAKALGSVAAPTAGLHFTPELLGRLETVDLSLHVGIGTFRPIQAERVEDHVLHSERAELTAEAAERLNQARDQGGRVVAVGTTSARVLEQSAISGRFVPFVGETALYLRPGHEFRGVDVLLTNFHLPRSSLLVLVAAFLGLDLTRAAYAEAIAKGYRFYSYGDAMLALP